MSNLYCPRIHHGLTLTNIIQDSLSYAVCCWAEKSVNTSTAIDFFHPSLVNLRNQNQQQKLPTDYCAKCLNQESTTNKKSMRQGYLETHGNATYDAGIQYLDINIDYTCNLACVTCGPDASTTWRKELNIKSYNVRPDLDNFFQSKLENLDLSQLREVRFWGGEPLLTLTHKKILEYIKSRVDPNQIKLMYNTNGTQRIDQDTKQLIEQFKFARISFSIDAIGKQFEYLRYPAKWTQVEETLMWWKENLPHNSMLSLTVTASILNVLDLDRVFAWHKENFSNSVFGDDIEIYVHQAFGEYGLESMPGLMIEHFKSMHDYCQPWIQQLDILGKNQKNIARVINNIQLNDRRRGLSLATVFPTVTDFINYPT
jgi:MoaA/NifB/PqqE/SkfB family radical SAM enzyme